MVRGIVLNIYSVHTIATFRCYTRRLNRSCCQWYKHPIKFGSGLVAVIRTLQQIFFKMISIKNLTRKHYKILPFEDLDLLGENKVTNLYCDPLFVGSLRRLDISGVDVVSGVMYAAYAFYYKPLQSVKEIGKDYCEMVASNFRGPYVSKVSDLQACGYGVWKWLGNNISHHPATNIFLSKTK